jgi:hypothetical protein
MAPGARPAEVDPIGSGVMMLGINTRATTRRPFRGQPPATQAVVSSDRAVAAAYRAPEAIAFYNQPVPDGVWHNVVTVRSIRAARMYEPGTWISRVSPTPLLMIAGLHATITVSDLALAAYERALQPKNCSQLRAGISPLTWTVLTSQAAQRARG